MRLCAFSFQLRDRFQRTSCGIERGFPDLPYRLGGVSRPWARTPVVHTSNYLFVSTSGPPDIPAGPFVSTTPGYMAGGDLSHRANIRCRPSEYAEWQETAKERGESFNQWARTVLNMARSRRTLSLPPQAREEEIAERVPVRAATVVGTGRLGEVSSGPVEQARESARVLAQPSGKCTADVERGVRCKFCGKPH